MLSHSDSHDEVHDILVEDFWFVVFRDVKPETIVGFEHYATGMVLDMFMSACVCVIACTHVCTYACMYTSMIS